MTAKVLGNQSKIVELTIIIGLCLLGIVIRAWRLSELGIIHFDEGVYLISGLWSVLPDASFYPLQVEYSPPLFVILIGLSYWLLGSPSDTAAILVNTVFSVSSIILLWWITRRWMGKGAGIATAVLLIMSEFHISYSRMALTDISFGFFYILSLAFITLTLERGSFRWAIVSGLVVGATLNTKYNGFFPLIIGLAVLFAAFLIDRQRERAYWIKRIYCWIIIAAVAAILYLPWFIYVENQPGGYMAQLRHHTTFLNIHWLRNLFRQAQNQLFFDGWLSRIAPFAAYLLSLVAIREKRQINWVLVFLFGIALLTLGLAFGGVTLVVLASLIAVPFMLKKNLYFSLMVFGSLCMLTLLTPLYTPYPRLLLPWVLCIFISGGVGIGSVLVEYTFKLSESVDKNKRILISLSLFGVLSIGIFALVGIRSSPSVLMPTNSLRDAASIITEQIPKNGKVLVHGGPEVAFYLQELGLNAIPIDYPIDHPNTAPLYDLNNENVFLVVGIYGHHREPMMMSSLSTQKDNLKVIGSYPIIPNDARLLNDFLPKGALLYRQKPSNEYDLKLYEIISSPTNKES